MQEWEMELASKLEEDERELRLKEISGKAYPDVLLDQTQYKQLECEDCSDSLVEFRLKRGFIRCVPCEQQKELRNQLGLK